MFSALNNHQCMVSHKGSRSTDERLDQVEASEFISEMATHLSVAAPGNQLN
jgi:hypothetical protein